jgi:8-hydroxy-5-deazaflavin:NADPH oxidoreductase
MRIGVLGTGMVGRALSGKLAELGHDTRMGTRDVASALAGTEAARDGSGTLAQWAERHPQVQLVTFQEAAVYGEIIVNATAGAASLEALRMAGEENLHGKVLIDVSNPLDFSRGMPPTLAMCNTTSLAEEIQGAFPEARVVKSLNTVSAAVMTAPEALAGGGHTMFVAGNDQEAKVLVEKAILRDGFGWKDVKDLGDIRAARGMEMYLPLWLSLMMAGGAGPMFNIAVVT